MFSGSITALVTPFRGGEVDEEALVRLVEWQISEGSHGLVPCGTTGESPTLTHEEHRRVVSMCIDIVAGRIPVIAGAGSNSTSEAVDFVQHAEKSGADAVLVVSPYYNKPDQRGLYRHFMQVREALESIPVILYNIPSRSVVDVSVETMARLHAQGAIAGVKDATGSMERLAETRARLGERFNQLSGREESALGFMAHGGHGCISVCSNVAPKTCSDFQNACLGGEFRRALELQDRLEALHRALFLEPSPAPAKYALSILGICGDEVRAPLLSPSSAACDEIRAAMIRAGVLHD